MEKAMDTLSSEFEFRVRWEPYMLRPQTPPEGLPIPDGYRDPNNPRVQYLRSVASSLGLDFNTNRKMFASTMTGHALLEYAKQVDDGDKQDDVAEKLFKKCFTDADDLQVDTCVNIAGECGLDKEKAREYIQDERNLNSVFNKAMSWSNRGISGVPTFYFNGQKMFSGAQESDVFQHMFKVVAEKYPVDPPASKS
ncbi:hypothetical protein ACF0H5_021145 [Mactra antiquata]